MRPVSPRLVQRHTSFVERHHSGRIQDYRLPRVAILRSSLREENLRWLSSLILNSCFRRREHAPRQNARRAILSLEKFNFNRFYFFVNLASVQFWREKLAAQGGGGGRAHCSKEELGPRKRRRRKSSRESCNFLTNRERDSLIGETA